MRAEDFTIDCASGSTAVLSGVMRPPSPKVCEEQFQPVRTALETFPSYTIDISGLRFMNSSGVTGLSRLVLYARSLQKPLTIIGASDIPWHGKTLTTLKRLYNNLDVQMR